MNFKNIIVSALTVTSMLLSTISVPVSAESTTTTNPWAFEKGANTFRFGVLSDVHVCAGDSNNVQQYMNMGLDAFEAMGVDGLALAGDITNSQLDYSSETIEENLYTSINTALNTYKYEIKSDGARANDESKKPMVYAMGNHEMPPNGQNPKGIQASKTLFVTENQIDDLSTARKVGDYYTGDYVTKMGDYTFIMSAPRNGLFEKAYTSYEDLNGNKVDIDSWVLEQIKAANDAYVAAGTPNKPIFYVQHIGVNDHYGINQKANTDEFMTALKAYPNVIVISAHTHYLLEDPRLISQDPGYTSIFNGVMATGNASVWGGNLGSIPTGGETGIKQQIAIDVTYDDTNKESNIKVYRMDIENQGFIGTPYEFTLDGTAPTKYSTQRRYEDEGRSKAAWTASAQLTATAVAGTRNVTGTYTTSADAATVTKGANAGELQDDFLWGYKVFAINKSTDVAEKTTRQAYEFFKETPSVLERSYSFNDLERDQEYEIRVYPITIFQFNDTYQELDEAGVVPLAQTVKTYNVKSDTELAQQMTRNAFVSKSKPVSFLKNDGTTTALTDGDINTYAEDLWDNVTLDVGFIVDLQKSYKITDVNLEAVANGATSGRNEFIIYGSNDKENWTQIFERKTSEINDAFGTNATDYLDCPVKSDYYRYVKIRYSGYTILREIKVYADIPVTNVAYGATVDASDTILSYASSFPLKNAVDGNNDTAVISTYDTDYSHYLQLDLGKKYPIAMIEYQKMKDNADTRAKSYWNAYGSNTVSDRATLQTKNALDTSVYTKLTKTTNKFFDETVDSISEKFTDYNEYQYITIRKEIIPGDLTPVQSMTALIMGEFRAFVENPAVAEFNYNDGTAKIIFTEEMNLTNINENITVYNSNGTAKAVTLTPNADNTVVTFAAESGDRVVVSQNITNTLGFGMHKDESYDVIDLSIDYSGKTKKVFKNVNVAYGKEVTSPTGYVSDIPAPDVYPDYYNESQLTNGVQHGFVSALADDFVIDLGRGYNLNKIVLKMHTNDVYTTQASIHYTLSASADGENWTPIAQATGVADEEIWNGKVGTHNITEDVNYRYIKYSHPYYFILEEIEAYADVEATQVTQRAPDYNTVTSSSANLQIYNNYLVDDWPNLTYVDGAGYNWISVEMDKAYPIGMYELYVRDWNESGSHGMDGWRNVHGVKLYGSNEAPVEQIDENTTNLSVADLTPYGFDVLGDTRSFEPWQALFTEAYPPVQEFTTDSFDKSSLMPEGWIFTNVYRETVNNTTKYKNLTLKKYDGVNKFIEYGEFAAYVLNATVNAVEADENGVDIHFGDKMVADLLDADTVKLTKDGVAIKFDGTLSENGMVYTLDADLADGTYTLTVADDVKNVLGVPMQADYTCEFKVGPVYGITTLDGAVVETLAPSTTYVVTEAVSGENVRMAIAAIYDKDHTLIASSVLPIAADYAKSYAEIEITTPDTLADGAYVRYFLWETNTLKPVINSIKVLD